MIWVIAKREIITRGRSKGFLAINALLFVGIIAAAVLSAVLGGDGEAREVTIGVTGDGAPYAELLGTTTDALEPTVESVHDAETALDDGTVDVVFDGSSLVWDGEPDTALGDHIRTLVQQAAIDERSAAIGLTSDDVFALLAPVEIDDVRLDGGDTERGVRIATAAIASVATFMVLQVWGAFLMMGVIEEKSSKVVEVLLAQVRPHTLLAGKVLGLGTLALVQMVMLAVGLIAGLVLVRDVDVPAGVWATVPLMFVTFLLGFSFYASAFAAVGSMVSRQEDAQIAQMPAMLPLVAGYIIAMTNLTNPDSPLVTIGSFVPFTAPVLLPFRTAMTDMPWWQVGISLALLAVGVVVMIRLAGGIYRYSLLRTGTRVRWREAVAALRRP